MHVETKSSTQLIGPGREIPRVAVGLLLVAAFHEPLGGVARQVRSDPWASLVLVYPEVADVCHRHSGPAVGLIEPFDFDTRATLTVEHR